MRIWASLGVVLLAGCASVLGGNTQRMSVSVTDEEGEEVPGAACTLRNDKGSWRLMAPGEAAITRSNENMEVRCEKLRSPPGVVSVESATRVAMYANILLPGGTAGAVLDHASGAAYEYPEEVKVVMGRTTTLAIPKPDITPESRAGLDRAAALPEPVLPPRPPPPPKPVHARRIPQASGFAEARSIASVPVRGDGRASYAQYLKMPTPKAFAVYEDGSVRARSGVADAMTGLLEGCARERRTCWLYAVDERVVWRENPAERIGRVEQLPPN